ncbi:MAG TPA: DHHA1 domain-containing protein [Vicinamibacterales bacterium]|nr:DHHA1 domain-containing protein [Vicinamibacterales bacterium]
MTTRLYYTDSHLTQFDAVVTSCQSQDGRIEVILQQTAFYPTSGGQPFDTGTIGDARVLDVVDRDDGEIVHVVDRMLTPGATRAASIDWPRRLDHMQQHTGQHVLSASFDRLFGVRTESFHLGAASASIDLAREVTAREIEAAEDEANRVVWGDRPVAIRYATAEEAAAMPLRKESARTGPLRLIDVEDFDLSACGGTHVARTGAIGIIATGSSEKLRGGSRVEFLCGGRALGRFREWRDALAAAMRHLSVAPSELAAGIERIQSDAKASQRTIRGLQEQLAVHQAKDLVAGGERIGQRLVIAAALDGWDAVTLKTLATAIVAAAPDAVVALFNRATPAVVIVARGGDADLDAAKVLKSLIAEFGGKGGGKPDLAQGGGLSCDAEQLVAAARTLLADSL